MKIKVMIAGLGSVGKSVLKMWENLEEWGRQNDIEVKLVAAVDSSGALIDENGLSAKKMLEQKKSLKQFAKASSVEQIGIKQTIDRLSPDVLLDLTPTNIESEPIDLKYALGKKIHVVASSKTHLASRQALENIEKIAKENNVIFLDCASVMGGVPVFEMLDGINAEVMEVKGILNGSSNFILEQLEEKEFSEALREAIKLGYAEANYHYDLQGHDTALKVVGIANKFFNQKIDRKQVLLLSMNNKLGIEGVTKQNVEELKKQGKKIKLIAKISRHNGGIIASVGPEIVSQNEVFYNVNSTLNAIQIKAVANSSELNLFASGPGSGGDATASRVVGNLKKLLTQLARERK